MFLVTIPESWKPARVLSSGQYAAAIILKQLSASWQFAMPRETAKFASLEKKRSLTRKCLRFLLIGRFFNKPHRTQLEQPRPAQNT